MLRRNDFLHEMTVYIVRVHLGGTKSKRRNFNPKNAEEIERPRSSLIEEYITDIRKMIYEDRRVIYHPLRKNSSSIHRQLVRLRKKILLFLGGT